jgi:hypothetical protein
MSPGITEEVGATTRSVVDALRVQPLAILLIILVATLLTYMYFLQTRQLDTRDRNLVALFDSQHAILEQWRQVFDSQEAIVGSMVKSQEAISAKLTQCLPTDALKDTFHILQEVGKPTAPEALPPEPSTPPS